MLEYEEILDLHDKAYLGNQMTRERAAEDLVFYWITQWSSEVLQGTQLAYRGEFDILRKAGRAILSDLMSSPVQVDFEAKDIDDNSDLVDGLYRADDNTNDSIETYETAQQETVVCGMGAWELYTEYLTTRTDDKRQVIKRRPIHEANNTAFCDPNAKKMDKSDADYWSILAPYSEDGYKKYVADLTGVDKDDVELESFESPEQTLYFQWITTNKIYYISNFYHRELITETLVTMTDSYGSEITISESKLDEASDDLLGQGFEIKDSKEIRRYQITKYIVSGNDILSTDTIAGELIPIVPMYGERAYIEGEEHWEGVTKLAKDPVRLRNFQLSYLSDIVSRSPRPKPIFWKEQLASLEWMYDESGADNNLPYLLQNMKAPSGETLPIGPVAIMPEQTMPQALIASIELSRQAVEDVANPGVPQDIADPDLSGKAVLALQNKIEQQSQIYQEHLKHAKRYDAKVWVSMAVDIMDVPRQVKVEAPDGTKKDVTIMDTITDPDSGDLVIINDLRNKAFDVYTRIGPSYNSQKEQTVERLKELYMSLDPMDPLKQIILLKVLRLMNGIEFDDIREYANKQLIILEVKTPETPEEEKILEDAKNAEPEPTAEMVLAQAEMLKGEADMAKVKLEVGKLEADTQNEGMKRLVDKFEAITDRLLMQVKAQEAGANMDFKRSDTFGKDLENVQKILELQDISKVPDSDLFQQLRG